MITALSYNRMIKEQQIIEKGCRRETGVRTEDKLSFWRVMTGEELRAFVQQEQNMDIIYYEVRSRNDVEQLKQLRHQEPEGLLMLMASPELSPVHYLKPGISPDLLLLKPFEQQGFDLVNAELFDALLERRNAPDCEEVFTLNTKEGKLLLPYSRILYFEACNKKINIRIGKEEYDFYDSIENLMQGVPEYFARSHRSYLINTRKIQRIRMSEGIVEMEGGASVLLSRTYKQEFKRLIR